MYHGLITFVVLYFTGSEWLHNFITSGSTIVLQPDCCHMLLDEENSGTRNLIDSLTVYHMTNGRHGLKYGALKSHQSS